MIQWQFHLCHEHVLHTAKFDYRTRNDKRRAGTISMLKLAVGRQSTVEPQYMSHSGCLVEQHILILFGMLSSQFNAANFLDDCLLN
jgi:hypothetical protein